jgi:mRNA interferase MazF
VIARGWICWAELGEPRDSAPAKRRPVVVIQADAFNRSRISTVIAAVVTSNTQAGELPGNVFLPAAASGLARDSVVNVTQLVTLNRSSLTDAVGPLPEYLLAEIDAGLRRVLPL